MIQLTEEDKKNLTQFETIQDNKDKKFGICIDEDTFNLPTRPL